ncbi:MAG: 3-carboxymuconate cyclase [Isosphaeraceae bacterium]|jgi:6-phosphogluconolactonase|nr:MAG: 3-carboxymuconate cyclase [Isosphaeraceae bacterium]
MRCAVLCLLSLLWAGVAFAQVQESLRIYVGTYTEGTASRGVYTARFDPDAGTLLPPELAFESPNPSFLAFHPNGKVVYAVAELSEFEGRAGGGLVAWTIEADGRPGQRIDQENSQGTAPCHLAVHPNGRGLIVANYGTGTVSVYRIADDGALAPIPSLFRPESGSGVNPRRQEGPHAHCVRFEPLGRLVLEADLGADRVHVLRFDPDDPDAPLGLVHQTDTAPGAGPRHLAFHPSGRFVYVNNELNSTITAYRFDAASGTLDEIETESTLPPGGHPGNSTAETVVHPSGRFVYVSNRGHDSIACFEIDPDSGALTPRGQTKTGGKTPRNFTIDPSGRWLLAANQSSDSLTLFAIDPDTGALRSHGEPVSIPAPVCIVFLPTQGRGG